MLAGGTMSVEVYAPNHIDQQTLHPQDDRYFVKAGRGLIIIDGQRFDAAAGDAFFVAVAVAAHVEHRFKNFSEDFVTRLVFDGPPGGE